jgi:hypothetical protein
MSGMTELLSYGNQIRRGRYKLHSTFTSAVNFFLDDAFVFVVDARVGAGPLNIVLEGASLKSLRSLEIHTDVFHLNDDTISFNDSTLYDSNIHIDGFKRNIFRHNLEFLEDALIEYSPPGSLAFLIDNNRKAEFTTAFDLAIVNRLEEGWKKLLAGDYRAGAQMMKGVGYGLTPGGDDFISGFLIALNVCQRISTTDLSPIVEILHRAAKGGNAFTNTFLDCAARGQVSEKFQNLIHVLCHSEENEIISCTRRLLTVGATSGADQAIGFLIGMKRFEL